MTVLAAGKWRTNGEMIADVARLYIDLKHDRVLDATYGQGGFWTDVRPDQLVTNDLDPDTDADEHLDFRNMAALEETYFDVAVYDPAYVAPGGRGTSTLDQMNAAYGMHTTEKDPRKQFQKVILPGASECVRLLHPRRRKSKLGPRHPGGLLLWKGQNYISSAKYHNFFAETDVWLRSVAGMKIEDVFIFGRPRGGPQPKGRTRICGGCRASGLIGEACCPQCEGRGRLDTVQRHAVNNWSYLMIARTQ